MASIEANKTKRLGVHLLLALMMGIHLLFVFMFKPDLKGNYPLFQSLDSYFLMQVVFDTVIVAALAKRMIEIEDDGMWQTQRALGIPVPTIIMAKCRYLAPRFFLVQSMEWIAIGIFCYSLGIFNVSGESLRLAISFVAQFTIHLCLLLLFLTIEVKTKKDHAGLFLSIIGAMTGIFTMLVSEFFCYINPFAWIVTLMNLDYIKKGEHFVQVMRPIAPYALPVSVIVFIALVFYVKHSHHFYLENDR